MDRVIGTMYDKFSVGYKVILEKATVLPQFQLTSIEDEYRPTYVNTLPGTTDIVTPIVKSMPVTQASQMPALSNVPPHKRDILEPMSNEWARSAYLEKQMQGMSSVKLPLDMPSLENNLVNLQTYHKEYTSFVKNGKRIEDMNGSLSRWL